MRDYVDAVFHFKRDFTKLQLFEFSDVMTRSEFFFLGDIIRAQQTGQDLYTIGSLAEKSNISPAAISRTVKHLTQKGWLQRVSKDSDRRTVYLKVTDQGLKEWTQIKDKSAAYMADYLAEIKPEDLETFLRVGYQFIDRVNQNKKSL
ncbi:MarR family winged helix-turn-helix transcriptional regulator [Eremococcus coleocola]|uniref:Transcriptional regulator, MarR family n=1 Tax=Eremococcus coleocola ACS-139-V-Col8 TaxID=908337 RepID=E4KN05_9LACT|nr:MarR family transcriptional regulator [Eremococcus coleocola]EFR31727.1 transcriptional regulator, MarR family [Eremococcus coleocola ACS-139-V-Col8]